MRPKFRGDVEKEGGQRAKKKWSHKADRFAFVTSGEVTSNIFFMNASGRFTYLGEKNSPSSKEQMWPREQYGKSEPVSGIKEERGGEEGRAEARGPSIGILIKKRELPTKCLLFLEGRRKHRAKPRAGRGTSASGSEPKSGGGGGMMSSS